MTATPASKGDVDTLWEQHNLLQQQHHALHNEHIELRGEVRAIRQNIDVVGRMIEDNRRARDAQHEEVMGGQRQLSAKVALLTTAEDKRDGMIRLGKYAAAVLTALGTTVVIGYTIWKIISSIKWGTPA